MPSRLHATRHPVRYLLIGCALGVFVALAGAPVAGAVASGPQEAAMSDTQITVPPNAKPPNDGPEYNQAWSVRTCLAGAANEEQCTRAGFQLLNDAPPQLRVTLGWPNPVSTTRATGRMLTDPGSILRDDSAGLADITVAHIQP